MTAYKAVRQGDGCFISWSARDPWSVSYRVGETVLPDLGHFLFCSPTANEARDNHPGSVILTVQVPDESPLLILHCSGDQTRWAEHWNMVAECGLGCLSGARNYTVTRETPPWQRIWFDTGTMDRTLRKERIVLAEHVLVMGKE